MNTIDLGFVASAIECAPYAAEALRSRREYLDRCGKLAAQSPDLAPASLAPSTAVRQPSIDCICSALSRDGRVYLFLPSGTSQEALEAVGRTGILLDLIGARPPYTRLLGSSGESRLGWNTFSSVQAWKLIAADMAFLGSSAGQLTVTPTVGEKCNFMWDLARHLFRSTDRTYNCGAHRDDSVKRQRLIDIFLGIKHEGARNVYVSQGGLCTVDEVVIVKRQKQAQPDVSLNVLPPKHGRMAIEESLLVSSERHGSSFWKRPADGLREVVSELLQSVPDSQLPVVKELTLATNLPGGDVPGFLYQRAANAVKTGSVDELPPVESTQYGSVFVGIEAYNRLLFDVIPRLPQIRMLVTSGEKVFHDGAFWRMVSRHNLELEVLLLDPDSQMVKSLERESYSRKPTGFLRDEIEANIEVMRSISHYLEHERLPARISCLLYKQRPPLRMTFFGQNRAVIANYVRGSRTGHDTPFFDLQGKHVEPFVEQLQAEYARVKKSARPID